MSREFELRELRLTDALKIIAWDDPRCTVPISAAGLAWSANTGIQIEVVVRPLESFNDQPLRELSPDCDLMVIDYPHAAQAIAENAIVYIEDLVGSAAAGSNCGKRNRQRAIIFPW